ncbi:MAG: hypothetical protein ACK5LS_01455 [Propioniciclava sp.]
MIENLKRLREPIAWIVILVTATSIVLALVRFGVEVAGDVPVTSAAQMMSLTVMNLTLVVLVVALCWVSVFVAPPVPRARVLVWWSAVLVTVGTLLTLLGAIGGLATSEGAMSVVFEFLGGILDIVLKAVGTVILWLMYRGITGGRFDGHATPPRVQEPAKVQETVNELPPTTWAPDAATGAVWTSAADAAAGAPAAVGNPGGTAWSHVSDAGEGSPEPDGSSEVTRKGTLPQSDPYRLDESE